MCGLISESAHRKSSSTASLFLYLVFIANSAENAASQRYVDKRVDMKVIGPEHFQINFFEVVISGGVELQLKKLFLFFIENVDYVALKWVSDELPRFSLLIYIWKVFDELCFQVI